MSENMTDREQNVFLYGKNRLLVTGIVSVDSFDENGISATTASGESIVAEGSDVTVTDVNLEKGQLEAEGNFTGIFYMHGKTEARGLFSKFFKAK